MTSKTSPGMGALLRSERSERWALETSERSWTYGELAGAVGSLARTLREQDDASLVGIFAGETAPALVGILASLGSGRAFVRLDPRDPNERTRALIRAAGCRVFVVDDATHERFSNDIGVEEDLVLNADAALSGPFSGERVEPAAVGPDELAYVHFASAGPEPQGVTVTRGALSTFLASMALRFDVGPEDRFLAIADPTSDLGVLEALLAWEIGACVCCPSSAEALLPTEFVRTRKITFWCLAPSRAAFLSAVGALDRRLFPSLRQTVFAGEDLAVDLARTWGAAAPESRIDLLYGPAEVTVACTSYRWDPERSPAQSRNGRLPLGRPLPGVEALVVDAEGRPLHDGQPGELVVGGDQVSHGYWGRPVGSGDAFLSVHGYDQRFFRTGDRVLRSSEGLLHHLGRIDLQIRVRGFRVDLSEIEVAVASASGRRAVALGHPMTMRGADGLVAFLESPPIDLGALQRELRRRLPRYMVPSQVIVLPSLPRTPTGSIDRNALLDFAERTSVAG